MVWRPEQCGAFLDAAGDDRLYNLFLMASQTGMRRGELCGLRWQDVDTDTAGWRSRCSCRPAARKDPRRPRPGDDPSPWTRASWRCSKAHRTQQEKDRMRWGELWVDSGRVFVRENGEQLEPDSVSNTFRKISREADLPPVRLHAMRSGAATMALAAGVPMKTVSEMLGHASEAITSKIYTAVGDELKREAITSIGVLIPRRATGTEEAL
jgi:integrase